MGKILGWLQANFQSVKGSATTVWCVGAKFRLDFRGGLKVPTKFLGNWLI